MDKQRFIALISSFIIVLGAQPDWSSFLCLIASSFGYTLFWWSLSNIERRKTKMAATMVWFGVIQVVQVGWLVANPYLIVISYLLLALLFILLGLQFMAVSLFVTNKMSVLDLCGMAGVWTLAEWTRLYWLSGYAWNPVGLALTANLYSLQGVSLAGILGMSFWILLTNLVALKSLQEGKIGLLFGWVILVVAPYLFGWLHVCFHDIRLKQDASHLSVLVVQPALHPEQKVPLNGSTPLSPFLQWERILTLLAARLQKATYSSVDLILLSESVVSFGARHPLCSSLLVKEQFKCFFPQITMPDVSMKAYADNLYWARVLADLLKACVIVGLEDFDRERKGSSKRFYNAAFLITPFSSHIERYEKQVLIPIGEYVPFGWCRTILAKYGIRSFFHPGSGPKIFYTKEAAFAISICYEETFGSVVREGRRLGANVLVNLSNDAWYPRSRLPIIHFFHGRLRAVETGAPLLRACNTGLTCGVDSLGRVIGMLDYENRKSSPKAGVLHVYLPLYHYRTLYLVYGHIPLIVISGVLCILLSVRSVYKRRDFFVL